LAVPTLVQNGIKLRPFASTAGRQRTCVRAPPASFEKYAAHFSNPAVGGTEPAEALPQVLVKNSSQSAVRNLKKNKSLKHIYQKCLAY
jgi:hypothetical protein